MYFAEKPCDLPPEQVNGHQTDCSWPYKYGSLCAFLCDSGYMLPAPRVHTIECVVKEEGGTSTVDWNETPTPCKRTSHASIIQTRVVRH